MKSDPYDDIFKDSAGDGDPADWPPGKPGRPYGVYPEPPGLRRDPSVSLEEAATAPAVRASRKPDEQPAAAPSFAAGAAPVERAPAASTPSPKPEKPLLRRQERFCQLYAVTGDASESAWQAGYSFPERRNQGYRLLRRPAIQARVAELQRDLARAIRFDHEVMLGKLEGIYRQAVQAKYFNAAARIVEIQARVAGHLRAQAALPPAATPAPENDAK